MTGKIWNFSLFVACLVWVTGCTDQKKATSPNIILILADDMGYSDLGCYGSEIPTPNIDALANNGRMFTQFYNEARCCPSRASLLTGLYPHQTGIGGMTEGLMYPDSTRIPSYVGYLNRNCITIAEALKENGYQTFMSGKWHVGDSATQWPADRGFDETFSLVWGCSNYFNTKPYLNEHQEIIVSRNGKAVQPAPGFYFTTEFTKYARKFIKEKHDDKPFFLYLAYTAPHWPIQALDEDIELFKGKYMLGWDSLRIERFNRMKRMGIIAEDTQLSPRFEKVPDWNSLSEEEKDVWDQRMAVYAAMMYRMDIGIGEIVSDLKKARELDNTIIMFLSDNGATNAEVFWATSWCAERGGPIGSEKSFESYGKWANTSNTPFRSFKSKTMEGGIITPFIFHWPEKFGHEVITEYPGHIIDILPTLLDVSGGTYPVEYNGNILTPLEGTSLMPVLNDKSYNPDRTLYWEHFGEKAVRDGNWKLVQTKGEKDWRLYNLGTDPSEIYDISKENEEIVSDLKIKYYNWTDKVGALPDTLYDDLIMIRNTEWFE